MMRDVGKFVRGFKRFQQLYLGEEHALYDRLVQEGQHPRALMIACCDSRCDPALLTDCDPGDMFVVRNVANLVPPFEPDSAYHGVSAALEFAVTQLEVAELVVMGHGFCGGCAAALTGQFDEAGHGAGHFIAHWIDMLSGARAAIRERHPRLSRDAFLEMELEGVRLSLANLLTFPWVAERVGDGRLKLHGAYFAIADGRLHVLDEASGGFAPV